MSLTGGSTGSGTGGSISVGGSTGSNGELFCAGTSVSGTVFAPSGTLPLYNVVVYVPSEPLEPLADGASCETCDGHFSGKPLAAVMSDATGKFTLDLSEVPTTDSLPLVVQIGKWRRELTVSTPITPCADNPLEDGFVRLPANQSEGSLPKIAVARGASDSLECLFRKIGVSDSEFTTDAGSGRIHLYASDEGEDPSTAFADGTPMPHPSTLYADLTKMMGYDAIFLACEGGGRGAIEDHYGDLEFGNIHAYANQGGRIFGSHYHNYWVRPDKIDGVTLTYPEVATFASSQHGFEVDVLATVDTSFPKGQAMYDWLANTGALDANGQLVIHDGEHTVDAAMAGVSTAWISVPSDNDGHSAVQYFSFNTPIGGAECGRMVFSDLHVGAGSGDSGKVDFPNGCVSTELTPQMKALAFMLFDLSSCVQPDGAEPPDPVIVK